MWKVDTGRITTVSFISHRLVPSSALVWLIKKLIHWGHMNSRSPAFSFPSIRRLLWDLWWENLEMNYCESCEIRLCFFSGGSVVKNLPAIAGDIGITGLILGLGRSPGEWYGNTLQYSCLESPKDRGAWWVSVCKVAESRAWLSNWTLTHTIHIHLWNLCIPWWLSGKESAWQCRRCGFDLWVKRSPGEGNHNPLQ